MMGNMVRASRELSDTDGNAQKGLEGDILVVIQDYPSQDVSEPFFRMGEMLRVVSQEAYWWRVRSVQTGKENYIPNSHIAKVYHGWLFDGVSREKAEELLLFPRNRVGSFMVRQSTAQRGVYSLSVRHRSIMHYRIFRMDNSWYYISPGLTFQCLEDMVNHYSDSADGLCCMLTSPCLSDPLPSSEGPQQPSLVKMRHKFDWKKVDRRELISTASPCHDNGDPAVSYGVRNSLAAYLSLSGVSDLPRHSMKGRKNKSKSVCVLPGQNLERLDYEDAP